MRFHHLLILACHTGLAALPETIDADSAMATALERNPGLTAARIALVEAEGRVEQSGRLTNPALETEFKPGLEGGQGTVKVGLEQQFPLTARLRLERQVSKDLLQAAQAEFRDATQRLAAEVRSAVFEVSALQARITLRNSQSQTITEWSERLKRQALAGERAGFEADQLRLDAATLRLELRRMAADRTAALAQLRLLLGLPVDSPLEVTQPLTPPQPAGNGELILAQRGDYQAARARSSAAQSGAELARARRWEDIGVGLFGEWQRTEDLPTGLRDDQYIGLRVSVPLPLWNRQQGRIREARAAAEREALAQETLARRIQTETETARRDMETAASMDAEITADLLPAAQRFAESLNRLAAEGQDVWTQQWRARERQFELESASLEARREFHLAHTRWLAATGQLPATHTAPLPSTRP